MDSLSSYLQSEAGATRTGLPQKTWKGIAQSDEDKKLTRLEIVFQENNRPHRLNHEIQKGEPKKRKVENQNHQGSAVGEVIFIKVTARVDMVLSNEVGAYELLHQHNLTGSPHSAPHGSAAGLLRFKPPPPGMKDALDMSESLLWIDEDIQMPKKLDQPIRLSIGVNNPDIYPENDIVSFHNGSEESERPRVSRVLLWLATKTLTWALFVFHRATLGPGLKDPFTPGIDGVTRGWRCSSFAVGFLPIGRLWTAVAIDCPNGLWLSKAEKEAALVASRKLKEKLAATKPTEEVEVEKVESGEGPQKPGDSGIEETL
ncbi:hypothetical protein CSUB01_09047 [Colletotrichum sublineola]|uniref:Uncharacterized protein n=1 Tax=Colletotrichum sublineola TaxID=1173701 RepID=A0A066XNQ7_COLSU|nr:hypothetical protein CSUB01_09047 [Colletotrichum sublineola]